MFSNNRSNDDPMIISAIPLAVTVGMRIAADFGKDKE